MSKGELAFVEWLRGACKADPAQVPTGIGDDMAALRFGDAIVTVTADMLLDGVHFETSKHSLDLIGRKAMGCSLSDCAAMGCRPRGAIVSVALPNTMRMEDAQHLYAGMLAMSEKFACPIVGGDTTSWDRPLAINVAMLAEPMTPRGPIGRGGAKPGDVLVVTGLLGGSILGKHLAFTPRLAEAEYLLTEFGPHVHAMIDISDGLVLDAYRLGVASNCVITLDARHIELLAGDRAREAARQDGRSALDHALYDGEDFELLIAMSPDAMAALAKAPRVPKLVGYVLAVPQGATPQIVLRDAHGQAAVIEPKGYEHFRGEPSET